jgi:hypothetical protein
MKTGLIGFLKYSPRARDMMSPESQNTEEYKDIQSSSCSEFLQRRRENVTKTSEICENKDKTWSS